MVKLQQNPQSKQLYFGLPKQVALAMGFKKGEEMNIRVVDKRTLVIRKKEL